MKNTDKPTKMAQAEVTASNQFYSGVRQAERKKRDEQEREMVRRLREQARGTNWNQVE